MKRTWFLFLVYHLSEEKSLVDLSPHINVGLRYQIGNIRFASLPSKRVRVDSKGEGLLLLSNTGYRHFNHCISILSTLSISSYLVNVSLDLYVMLCLNC